MTKREQLIQQVTSGTHAIHNDGDIVQLFETLRLCYPHDNSIILGFHKFYVTDKKDRARWIGIDTTDLPTISVKEFYEDEGEKGNYYRHCKGGNYELLLTGKMESDEKEVAIYKSLKNGMVWVRPMDEFNVRFTPMPKLYPEQEVPATPKNEDEFVWGQEVEASSDNQHWIIGKYIAPNPNNKYLTLITKDYFIAQYQYIRKLPTKLKLTPQMIADKFGIEMGTFEIIN